MRRQARGFTLIELLVVLSIIAVLAALSAAATARFVGVQQASNTRATLAQLQSRLDAQWAAVTRRAKEEAIPPQLRGNPDFLAMAGADAHADPRARVVHVKLRLRQAFPASFDEALNPYPLPPLAPYAALLRGLGVRGSTPETRPYESS